jgi:hypothetical protein
VVLGRVFFCSSSGGLVCVLRYLFGYYTFLRFINHLNFVRHLKDGGLLCAVWCVGCGFEL